MTVVNFDVVTYQGQVVNTNGPSHPDLKGLGSTAQSFYTLAIYYPSIPPSFIIFIRLTDNTQAKLPFPQYRGLMLGCLC